MKNAAAAVVLALTLLASSGVSAQASTPARQAFSRGVAALRANDFPAAETAFARSQELEPRAATLCNLALTYDRWGGHERQAITSYEACADADESGRFEAHARERAQAMRATEPTESPETTPAERGPNPFAAAETPRSGTNTGDVPVVGQEPLAPGATRVTLTTEDRVEHSHGLLWAGLASFGVGAGLFAGGFVLVNDVESTERYLDATYDGGRRLIEPGSSDASRLASADRKSGAAVALYVLSGLTLALGAVLISIDIATTRGGETATLGLSPLPGGGLLTARLELR